MVLDAAFFILRIWGQKKFADLRRPVDAGDNPVGGIIRVSEGQSLREDVTSRFIYVSETLAQEHFDHVAISVVQNFFKELWGAVHEVIEIPRLYYWVQFFSCEFVNFFGSLISLGLIFLFLFVLPRQQQINVLFIIFSFLGRSAIERSGFKGTLDLHIIGLD